jgi:hypothetical protein
MVPVGATGRRAGEPVVREQRGVFVQGTRETWRLIWARRPATFCEPDEVYMAMTCPCSGWAYGEYGGDLSLVRSRFGHQVERMDLRSLFGDFDYSNADPMKGSAYAALAIQIRGFRPGGTRRPDLVVAIKRRPASVIMVLADYDRDGAATEFLLQVGTLPCGKHQFAAVGTTARHPRLQALTTVARPGTPLIMPIEAWRALLQSGGPTVVPTWDCRDHGSDRRAELVVSANDGEIRVKSRVFSCPVGGDEETLLEGRVIAPMRRRSHCRVARLADRIWPSKIRTCRGFAIGRGEMPKPHRRVRTGGASVQATVSPA